MIESAMRKLLITIPILLFAVTACDDPFLNQTYVEKTDEDLELSNASYLKKNTEDFSLWIELLKYADLYNALNDASTTSTVFAPDNEAMEEFLAWKGVSSVTELDKDYARYVAQVHILNDDLGESSFITYVESGTIPIMTVFGTYLSTSYGYINKDVDDAEQANMTIQDSLTIYLNNQAKVKSLARKTANGQVYTLGGVIHPLSETILDVLKPYNEYDLFIQAAEMTGYDKVVSVYADTMYNLDGSMSVNDIRFTCLAVPDAVYNAAGISDVNGLIALLGAEPNYTDTTNALYQYLAYHFMGKTYSKDELFKFQTEGQISIFDTKLRSQVITVQNINGVGTINGVANITRSGIKARNGVIHKINHILPVFEPDPVTIRWDFCNYADIESFVNTYGETRKLGELFSNDISVKEYQIDLSLDQREGNNGTISSFIYQANKTSSSYASWRKVGFFKCSYVSSTKKTVNKYGAYMNNLLTLNLGYAGWIQFRTPTIIKGKYKVVFYYAGAPGLKSFYSSGSLTKFNLDDYQKSIYVWKGLPGKFVDDAKKTDINANGIAADVLWDVLEFTESGSHTFKVTMMDINAKTNNTYRQMWDYIELVPIAE
jgi:uncharacterized surface protein with fasciclin (FAS1) repeats